MQWGKASDELAEGAKLQGEARGGATRIEFGEQKRVLRHLAPPELVNHTWLSCIVINQVNVLSSDNFEFVLRTPTLQAGSQFRNAPTSPERPVPLG